MLRGYAGGVVTGLVISGVLAIFGPVWLPVVSRKGRPAARMAIRQAMTAFDSGRTRLAELRESLEDLVAEAEMERLQTGVKDVPPAAGVSGSGQPRASTL